MRNRLHALALGLFVLCFFYDVVVWGGLSALGEVGEAIADSARREAPLATTYIAIGSVVDSIAPALRDYGSEQLAESIGPTFERIRADPTASIDLVFGDSISPAHRWLKATYWAAPVLLLLTLILWVRRPRQVRALRH